MATEADGMATEADGMATVADDTVSGLVGHSVAMPLSLLGAFWLGF